MARSTYYRPGKPESELNLLLMRWMDELHTENPTWGSRKLRNKLRLEGQNVNRKRMIGTFISKYNEERPHALLDGLTPVMFYDN